MCQVLSLQMKWGKQINKKLQYREISGSIGYMEGAMGAPPGRGRGFLEEVISKLRPKAK